MRLLSFIAENHRSFRDEFALEMTRNSWRTAVPRQGESWADACLPVAAIFGPNASGKTAVLDAMRYAMEAIQYSASRWLQFQKNPRSPFKLDEDAVRSPSFFALDFTLTGGIGGPELAAREIRYHYEFSISANRIEHELLLGYFSSRPTRLLERDAEQGITSWHKYLGPRISPAPRELVLSRGYVAGHDTLQSFVGRIIAGVDFYDISDSAQRKRLDRITADIADERIPLNVLTTLAAVADIGITRIDVDERELPPEIRKVLERAAARGVKEPGKVLLGQSLIDHDFVNRTLRFFHHGNESADAGFLMRDESSGTLAWLAMAVPILEALRDGTIFCVDELDTSLHPSLAEAIVALFQDQDTNPHGAQLIFTSHDVTLLQPQSSANLTKEQVWFTEKDSSGASTLYNLQDFRDLKPASNLAKQYLEGRFGALPYLLPGLMRSAVEELSPTRRGQENGERGSA